MTEVEMAGKARILEPFIELCTLMTIILRSVVALFPLQSQCKLVIVQVSYCTTMIAIQSLTECRKMTDYYKVAGLKKDKYKYPNKSIWCH